MSRDHQQPFKKSTKLLFGWSPILAFNLFKTEFENYPQIAFCEKNRLLKKYRDPLPEVPSKMSKNILNS